MVRITNLVFRQDDVIAEQLASEENAFYGQHGRMVQLLAVGFPLLTGQRRETASFGLSLTFLIELSFRL